MRSMVLGLFDSAVPYKDQHYNKLKKQCISKGELFVDPVFPPDSKSLFYSKVEKDIVWKRPGEISHDPKFFVEGASFDDFSQGSLGNCWFVAACACLTADRKLLTKVVPDIDKQEWSEDNKYSGIFHFRFWRCGTWTDVVIDDYLPTKGGRLIFVQSKARNEFWSALLEKAYAKLFGNYESLVAGRPRDALVDITGGVGELLSLDTYKTEAQKLELFDILHESVEQRSLMSASIAASANEMEAELDVGLVKGHAYSVTAVRDIKLGTGLFSVFNAERIHMVRCRNPWGGTEWKGAWSDGSAEWKKVSSGQKKDIGLTVEDNGEFWMSYEDFVKYFNHVDICHVMNTSFFSLSKTWSEAVGVGQWKKPDRCGGSASSPNFLKNPQYVFDIKGQEDDLWISLEQEDKSRLDKDKGGKNESVGAVLIKVDENREFRIHDMMKIVHQSTYTSARSLLSRIQIKKGRYCVIPSTFDEGSESHYALRLYSSGNTNFKELLYEEPQSPKCGFICKPKIAATQITVISARGLKAVDKLGSSDPFCIIKCDGYKEHTNVVKKNTSPDWGERFTFYHKKPDKDIIVEVWDHNIIRDTFLGVCTVSMSSEKRNKYKEDAAFDFPLYGKGKEANVQKDGKLKLKIWHTKEMELV
ncbi:calpain-5 [Mytilus galloprovincialis]|uniref:Calpain-5 n=2 Tax=Mytilus galloprovincialis TaxID=29158 RepID=A0A8B6E753_MYTGA|nr:calpain-5 [Mytilus galloprovincialis]